MVEPALRADLAAVRINGEDMPDEIADFALRRAIGKFLKAYGQFLAEKLRGVNVSTWKFYDRATSCLIGAILSLLFRRSLC